MMVVEFFGLPGCGKTFISSEVASLLAERGVSVEEPTRVLARRTAPLRIAAKLCLALRFSMRHPVESARLLGAVSRTRQHSAGDLVKSLFNLLFVLGLLRARRNRRRVVLLDQGIVQACASVRFGASRELPAALFSLLPAPEVAVRVTAEEATVARRLRGRGTGESRAEADPAAALPAFAAAFRELEESSLMSRVRFRLQITNEESPALRRDAAAQLAGRIIDAYKSQD